MPSTSLVFQPGDKIVVRDHKGLVIKVTDKITILWLNINQVVDFDFNVLNHNCLYSTWFHYKNGSITVEKFNCRVK